MEGFYLVFKYYDVLVLCFMKIINVYFPAVLRDPEPLTLSVISVVSGDDEGRPSSFYNHTLFCVIMSEVTECSQDSS